MKPAVAGGGPVRLAKSAARRSHSLPAQPFLLPLSSASNAASHIEHTSNTQHQTNTYVVLCDVCYAVLKPTCNAHGCDHHMAHDRPHIAAYVSV
jgi:hypothetical protein